MSDNELILSISKMMDEKMDEKLRPVQDGVTQLKSSIDGLNVKTELMKTTNDKVDSLAKQVNELQLTLENDTNKSIKIIAEGHLDLSRKLDDALKVENEREMFLLRMNLLESELRRLKGRIEQIA